MGITEMGESVSRPTHEQGGRLVVRCDYCGSEFLNPSELKCKSCGAPLHIPQHSFTWGNVSHQEQSELVVQEYGWEVSDEVVAVGDGGNTYLGNTIKAPMNKATFYFEQGGQRYEMRLDRYQWLDDGKSMLDPYTGRFVLHTAVNVDTGVEIKCTYAFSSNSSYKLPGRPSYFKNIF